MKKEKSKVKFFSNADKDTAINHLLEVFVEAREKTKFRTNKRGFDEDVNIYISHLLFAVALSNYNYITEQYISLDQSDVTMLIDLADNNYLKYFIHKVNGDNLLLHLGVFHHNLKSLINLNKRKNNDLKEETFIKLAQYYYQEAANNNQKIHRKSTALSEVLDKLKRRLPEYARALKHMSTEYYNFYNNYEDEEFTKFRVEINKHGEKQLKGIFIDKLLDIYSEMKRNPSRANIQRFTQIQREAKEKGYNISI